MDIGAIASAAIPAIVPFLIKGGEKISEKIAEEGFEERGKIWQIVKRLFGDDELVHLNLFADNPNDGRLQGKIEGKLEEKLKHDVSIAAEIARLLERIPSHETSQSISVTGDGNKVVQDVSNSTINIG